MTPPTSDPFWNHTSHGDVSRDQAIVDALVRASRDIERLADLVHRGHVKAHTGEHERRHPERAAALSRAVYASLSQRSMRMMSGPSRGLDTIRPKKRKR